MALSGGAKNARRHRLVPPDVATGRVVVVVGGGVVVVVGGDVVVVVGDEVPAPRFDEAGVRRGGEVVVVGAIVVEVLGVCSGALPDAVAPGCSLATTTPMTTVAPVGRQGGESSEETEGRRSAPPRVGRVDLSCGLHRSFPCVGSNRSNQPRIRSSLASCCGRTVKHPRMWWRLVSSGRTQVRSWRCASDRGRHGDAQRMLWRIADSFIAPARVGSEPEGTMTAAECERGRRRSSLNPMSHLMSPDR